MEPGRDGGVVSARKASAVPTLGQDPDSHAGVRGPGGRSAIDEMGAQMLRIEAKTDYAEASPAIVGLVNGGTGVNVVSPSARAKVDLRVPDRASLPAR